MKDSFGPVGSPIWLIADSPPAKWKEKLEHPLDPRHPTRHSIWTPVENYIQDALFEKNKSRVDVSAFYVTNAIDDPGLKPKRPEEWDELGDRIEEVRKLIGDNRPRMIVTFGSFAFRYVRFKPPPFRRADFICSPPAGRVGASLRTRAEA